VRNLRKVEVIGFKSFADRTDIRFGAGITGIVGPNGCGKSNVADAIRWVLGEQSAKLLRGSSMTDVIFNGAGKRKSLSYAEVSLYFNNAEDESGVRLFSTLDYKEVVISRRLSRDGESEYRLNKETCRLKDISELLRTAHMGREGYSIIGQGRIDELLSAKPDDRRAIFEEAAGITQFKIKKLESERKLARTADNLVRLSDILREKASQLEPLTRQSQNARRYLNLRDQLRHHEINIYIHQHDNASNAKRVIAEKLHEAQTNLDNKNKANENLSVSYNETIEKISSVDRSVGEFRQQILDLTVDITREEGELKLLNERLTNTTELSHRLQLEIENAKREYSACESDIKKSTVVKDDLSQKLELAKVNAQTANTNYLTVVEELAKGESELEKWHQEVVNAADKLADIKANMGRLLAEKEALNTTKADLAKRLEFLNSSTKGLSETDKSLLSEIETFTNGLKKAKETLDSETAIHNEAVATIAECANQLDKLSSEYHSVKAKLDMVTAARDSSDALGMPTKKLLRDAKERSDLANKIEGVVAGLVKVKNGFETAIATAFGNSIQNIVTKSEEEAKFLIAYLKEKRYGQVTFLPMNSIKPRRIDNQYLPLLKLNGVLGEALGAIEFDKKYESVFKGLLGSTVIVKDMDSAVILAKKSGYSFRIVTLEGDIINTSGAITGGSKRSSLENVFIYDKEIAEFGAKATELESSIKSATSLRDAKAKILESAKESLKTQGEKIHSLDVTIAAKKESHSAITENLLSNQTAIEELLIKQTEAIERIEAIENDINSVEKLEEIVNRSRSDATSHDIEQKAKFDVLRAKRDELSQKDTEAKIALNNIEGEIVHINQDIERLQLTATNLCARIEYNSQQLAENKEQIKRTDTELKGILSKEKKGDAKLVAEIEAKLAQVESQKEKLQENLVDLEKNRGEILVEIQEAHEAKAEQERLLALVDTELEYMQQRVLEEYELTYGACLVHKEHGYDAVAGEASASQLKKQISSLGHVNIDSIEQCKALYEDYSSLNMQKEDLLKAKDDLEKIIADLSKEMLSRFTHQFETIRANFVTIFRELFNGGTADLMLLESENPLEAGIEIVAQPPEKKLQTISLLSGGERALTAIAILFAILKLRPMPFCVLDEIEAALDDANAGRFAKYLRRFSAGTQFIVITHRKPTMELADALYGVTMEEKGVSKIVSVKLAEAVSVAEI